MPANLPPQYHSAYQKYREAKTLSEKISALKEMFAVMPKHKGTDKLQAEIKRKIAQLKQEQQIQKQKRKGGGFVLPKREGAGQVCLVGAPNCGKSSLLKTLTNAQPEIADYPFTTKTPNIGMMPFEDIKIQIIDLPPFSSNEVPWWQREIVRNADLVLFILDLANNDFLKDWEEIKNYLESKNIFLKSKIEREEKDETIEGPVEKTTIIVGNKIDFKGAGEKFHILSEFLSFKKALIAISCKENINIKELKELIFQNLAIIRVYTKQPGRPPDLKDPLILSQGAKVIDAAQVLHKDFAQKLKYARIWGSAKFEGQRVPQNYILQDKDIIEFHI